MFAISKHYFSLGSQEISTFPSLIHFKRSPWCIRQAVMYIPLPPDHYFAKPTNIFISRIRSFHQGHSKWNKNRYSWRETAVKKYRIHIIFINRKINDSCPFHDHFTILSSQTWHFWVSRENHYWFHPTTSWTITNT